ncbi:hypothetical protein LTR10_003882 [Elasticomyces elasticus]|nr:hypothetical protein LTR10_003882 [Elasticomyces elasticus]KAK4977932.1 hypothetical protein LTR42_002307 [Elasticomyces elasticus]
MSRGRTPTQTHKDNSSEAVVGLLRLPKDAVNRPLKVASVRTTQNEILAALRSITSQQQNVKQASTRDLLQKGHKQIEAGDLAGAHELNCSAAF